MKFYVGLLMLLVSSCQNFPPPKGEICTAYGDGSGEFACIDTRTEKEYDRYPHAGDILTNGKDYQQYYNYCNDLRKELIELRNGR